MNDDDDEPPVKTLKTSKTNINLKTNDYDSNFSLAQVMNFINKFLEKKTKHDVLFYSTLLAKLMESAYKVIDINTHIEQLTYNVTLRNPGAIEILKKVPPHIVGNAFEALADAKRAQVNYVYGLVQVVLLYFSAYFV